MSLFTSNKSDTCKIIVTFLALEVDLKDDKNTMLSLVFKRGDQQRNETQRIRYKPLKPDQNHVSENKKLYDKIIKKRGIKNKETDIFDS